MRQEEWSMLNIYKLTSSVISQKLELKQWVSFVPNEYRFYKVYTTATLTTAFFLLAQNDQTHKICTGEKYEISSLKNFIF